MTDALFPDWLQKSLKSSTTSQTHSGDWLFTIPITSCGLRLDDEVVRVAVGLRLGAPLCEPHSCVCSSLVTAEGSHGLSCGLGRGRTSRHASLNDLIFRSLARVGHPSAKEPVGLLRTDGKRPDSLTLIPRRAGRSLQVWDVTVTILGPGHMGTSFHRRMI